MDLCSHSCETHGFIKHQRFNCAGASFLRSKVSKSAYRETADKSSGIPPAGTLKEIVGHSACRDTAENHRAFRLQRHCGKSSCTPLAGTLWEIVEHSACRDNARKRRAIRLQGHCEISSCIPPAGKVRLNRRTFRLQENCGKSSSIPPAARLREIVGHSACRETAGNR